MKCVSSPTENFMNLVTHVSGVELNMACVSNFKIEMADISSVRKW